MVNKRCGRHLSRPNSGGHAHADRARNTGAAETAVTSRILGEILLMIVLGEIERARRRELGGDRAKTFRSKRAREHRLRVLGGLTLRIAEGVDRRPVLGTD